MSGAGYMLHDVPGIQDVGGVLGFRVERWPSFYQGFVKCGQHKRLGPRMLESLSF